jgi:hypothetical protein
MPDNGGSVSQFLDVFLRGNRDDQPRKTEGSILQALGLMNDPFIQNRIHATGTGATATFLAKLLAQYPTDEDTLVNMLFLNVLNRYPTADEKAASIAQLNTGPKTFAGIGVNMKTNAEDLLWALFNKVDFLFNY